LYLTCEFPPYLSLEAGDTTSLGVFIGCSTNKRCGATLLFETHFSAQRESQCALQNFDVTEEFTVRAAAVHQ